MAYEVLARKWRPQTFAKVVGQEHITRTLQNAITQNRVGHAYLFVGPRGIGKTTTARIFAKALNCRKGIVPEPCCECASCRDIAAGNSLDVLEIDGASHNRVEHIRDLRSNVQYTPSNSRYKIYIIDEVHMLTPSAWNALLKTLEEPPEHVKFLFATTEPHKVLPTILSRCQRFDLKRLTVPQISGRLRHIADDEGIHIDDRALAAIARAADGGMRDGQSIFDQIIAFCGGANAADAITEDDVISVFGLASGLQLRAIAAALLEGSLDDAMQTVQTLADQGRDLERLYTDLVEYVRNILVAAVCSNPEQLLEVDPTTVTDLTAIGQAVPGRTVQRILQCLLSQERSFRSALNKRVYLEAALAQAMLDAHSVQIEDVITQLNALRDGTPFKDLPAPGPAPRPRIPPPGAARPSQPPQTAAPPAPETPATPVAAVPETPAQGPQQTSVPKRRPDTDAHADAGDHDTTAEPEAGNGTAPRPEPATTPASTAPTPVAAPASAGKPAATPPQSGTDPELQEGDAEPEPPTTPAAPASPPPSVQETTPEDGNDSDGAPAAAPPPPRPRRQRRQPEADPQTLWNQVLDSLPDDVRSEEYRQAVTQLRPVAVHTGDLLVAYDDDVPDHMARELSSAEGAAPLTEALRSVLNPDSRVVIKRWIDAVSSNRRVLLRDVSPETRARIEANPLVQRVCQLTDGRVIDLRA